MRKISNISVRLKYLRKDILGLNQDELALKLGFARTFISNLEKGKRNLTDRTILDICREFNVTEEWLRYGKVEVFKATDDDLLNQAIAKHKITDENVVKIIKNFFNMSKQNQVELVMLAQQLFNDEQTSMQTTPDLKIASSPNEELVEAKYIARNGERGSTILPKGFFDGLESSDEDL